MKITIEGDAKEIAALLGKERLIDAELDESTRRFVERMAALSPFDKEFVQDLHKTIAEQINGGLTHENH